MHVEIIKPIEPIESKESKESKETKESTEPTESKGIEKAKELSKLFEIERFGDISEAVYALSEGDARMALVMAIVQYRQNKKEESTRIQQLQEIRHQLAASKKEISQLQGHITAKQVDSFPSPTDYKLPMLEHNMAVMIRFFFRTCPPEYAEFYIRRMFAAEGKEDKKGLDKSAGGLLLDIRKEFSRQFRQERDMYGFTSPKYDIETNTVSFEENPNTPAINAINTFKMKNPYLDYISGKPNVGDINSVKPGLIVDNPSENFLRFLHDMADFFAGQSHEEDA